MSTDRKPPLGHIDEATLAAVQTLLADVLGLPAAEIAPEAALIDDLGTESIDFLDISFRLEQEYGCALPTTEWADFLRTRASLATPDDVPALVEAFERIFGVPFPATAREQLMAPAVDVRSDRFRTAMRRVFTVDVLARFVARHRKVAAEASA